MNLIPEELRHSPCLVVCANQETSIQVRKGLAALDFNDIVSTTTHSLALGRIQKRHYPLVLFEAAPTIMPTHEFVREAITLHQDSLLITLSFEPQIDDVFGLLREGAQGFVVLPTNTETLEHEILRALHGPALNEELLTSKDRNGALSALILSDLYKLAVIKRQARVYATAQKLLHEKETCLKESVSIAKMFCEGSVEELGEKIMDACITRANTQSSKLGRTRQKLKKERQKTN